MKMIENNKPKIINVSQRPLHIDFDTKKAKKLIFLPDYSLGKGILHVGTVTIFDKKYHTPNPSFLGPDIGCGMLLAKYKEPFESDPKGVAYSITSALRLREDKQTLGTLGGGNHFINLYEVQTSKEKGINPGEYLILIHSGSRGVGVELYLSEMEGDKYIEEHNKVVDFAMQNREKLLELVQEASQTQTETIFNNIHNYLEVGKDNYTYRKGAVKLNPGQLGVISSSMTGNAVLIRAKESIKNLENSMCHGTGRKISRRDCKKMYHDEDEVRKKVYMPSMIMEDVLWTEDPKCYRTLDETLPLINQYVDVVAELKPKTCSK